MRVLFAAMRGGLGASTAAASLALAGAQRGQRVLVVGMQGDLGVARALGVAQASGGPTEVGPGLNLLVVDPAATWAARGPQVAAWLSGLMQGFGVDSPGPELALSPGAQELAAWLEVAAAEASGAYDLVVLDAGAGASAARLAALPAWAANQAAWAEPLLPRLGAAWAILGPMMGAQVAPPQPAVLAELDALWRLLKPLPASLGQAQHSVARVLAPADGVEEEHRAFVVGLGLAGWHVDAILQRGPAPEWLAKASEPAKVVDWPQEAEGQGGAKAMALGGRVWSDAAPWQAQESSPTQRLGPSEEGEPELSLRLPGISSKGLALVKRGPTVYLTVGKQRRAVLLPGEVSELSVTKAKCSGGWLKIRFARA